jgi:hypothetical protein
VTCDNNRGRRPCWKEGWHPLITAPDPPWRTFHSPERSFVPPSRGYDIPLLPFVHTFIMWSRFTNTFTKRVSPTGATASGGTQPYTHSKSSLPAPESGPSHPDDRCYLDQGTQPGLKHHPQAALPTSTGGRQLPQSSTGGVASMQSATSTAPRSTRVSMWSRVGFHGVVPQMLSSYGHRGIPLTLLSVGHSRRPMEGNSLVPVLQCTVFSDPEEPWEITKNPAIKLWSALKEHCDGTKLWVRLADDTEISISPITAPWEEDTLQKIRDTLDQTEDLPRPSPNLVVATQAGRQALLQKCLRRPRWAIVYECPLRSESREQEGECKEAS